VPFGQNSEGASKNPQAIRILHVEDSPIVAGLVRQIAEHESWEVKTCIDGHAASEELVGHTQYDLLLVNFELPILNGLELIEEVRTMPRRRYMSIVMMSGTLSDAVARKAGANAFLRKPQDIGLLVETINRLLGNRDSDA
jgi:CheY-like chemotaxis protein